MFMSFLLQNLMNNKIIYLILKHIYYMHFNYNRDKENYLSLLLINTCNFPSMSHTQSYFSKQHYVMRSQFNVKTNFFWIPLLMGTNSLTKISRLLIIWYKWLNQRVLILRDVLENKPIKAFRSFSKDDFLLENSFDMCTSRSVYTKYPSKKIEHKFLLKLINGGAGCASYF